MRKTKSLLFNCFKRLSAFLSKIGVNKRTPGALFLYNFLFQKLWPYKKIIEIQGSKMYTDINDESFSMRETFQSYATNKIHEKATTGFFKKFVKQKDIVLDLGANIGYFTLLAAKLVGKEGKVFSFEPEPKNFGYLSKNIELNDYKNVNAFQKAVSDKNGKTKLYVCTYDTGHHTINQYQGIESYSHGRSSEKKAIEIEMVALDNFLADKTSRVDVVKMDVEGAEMLALLGMDRILRSNHNIKMFVEFFPLLIEKMGNSPKEFIRKLLEDYGFSIFVIPEDYNASKGEMVKINSVEEVMQLRKEEADHINLFVKKD